MTVRVKKKASSVIEYMALIVFILTAFFVFQRYILKGLSGRWQSVGDTFGHGKQYDPRNYGVNGIGGGTRDQTYNDISNTWVDVN